MICFVSCLLNLIVTLCFDHVPFSRCMSRGPFSLNMNPRQHALVRWAGDAPVEASKDRGRSIALWLFYDFNKIMIGSFGVIKWGQVQRSVNLLVSFFADFCYVISWLRLHDDSRQDVAIGNVCLSRVCCHSNITGKTPTATVVCFTIDEQWLENQAIKFARWQHPAMGRAARFAVPQCTLFWRRYCYLMWSESTLVLVCLCEYVVHLPALHCGWASAPVSSPTVFHVLVEWFKTPSNVVDGHTQHRVFYKTQTLTSSDHSQI